MPKRPVALAEMPRQPGVALAAARSWAASMPAALRETTQASLSRKIATFYGLLLTLALGLVLVSSNFGISLVADHILGREFASESRVFESLREMRYDQMQHGAELLAADFGFRSAVATGDAPTIASALDSLGQRMGNGRALFIGTEGNVVGGGQDVTGADKTYLVDAVERGSTRGVLTLGGRYYAAVAASVNAPDQLGWILFISPLGKREMARLVATSAMPLHAQIVSADSLERDIPIVKAGSEVSVERRDLGERMLVQASSVADFGGGRPQVLVLEYSLSQALDAYAPMFRILLASCVAALVIAIAGSLYLARKLARPIEALGAAAERVSYGEFVRVEAGGDGEVADLIDAFNKMVAGIEDREHQIAQAQTRLELRIREVQQENMRLNAIAAQQRGAALAEAATALDAQLAPVLLTFDSEADRLFVAARDMRENLRAAKARASETGQSAQRTENATHLIAANAGELATSGKRIATEAGTTLDLVSRAANDSAVAAASFAGLRQAVQEITSVTDEIRAISGRTNMLAINATIEAARAGAAGRNFAVVAGEVKDLARQTAALTATIGDRLALVGQAATGADETLNQVRAALDSAAGVTGAIAGAARAQADATGGISQGISDIAVESRTAAESINQIEVAAGASVDMADQVQGSAETVASRAHQLRETVEQFLVRLRLSA